MTGADPAALRAALALLADDGARANDELTVARRGFVQTADRTRHRIERDLHDGAQQRFVSLGVTLQLAERLLARGDAVAGAAVLQEVADGLDAGLRELTQLTQGIRPDILRTGGLAAALQELAEHTPMRVALEVAVPQRLDDAVETATYFVVSEGLSNAVKHAEAAQASVAVTARGDGLLAVTVADDGRGGAEPEAGSGLHGLSDRVAALGGRLSVDSPAGGGTTLTAVLPQRRSPAR